MHGNNRPPARIAIVDNDPLALKLLTTAAAKIPFCTLIWVCEHGTTAIRRCLSSTQTRPDVLIVDMSLDDMTGDQVCAAIRQENTDIAIIGITAYTPDRYRQRMIDAGAQTLISKDRLHDCLIPAVAQALTKRTHNSDNPNSTRTQTFPPPRIANDPPTDRRSQRGDKQQNVTLSQREYETLSAYAQGLTTREIASHFHVTESTVYSYQSRAVHKLNARNITQAVVTAIRKGLL